MTTKGHVLTFVLLAAISIFLSRELAATHAMSGSTDPARAQQQSEIKPNATPACATVPAGIVSWWPFDGNALDFYLNHNGGPGGTTFYVGGFVDRALHFDNLDGVLVGGGPSSTLNVGAGDGFTIDLWINSADTLSQHPL